MSLAAIADNQHGTGYTADPKIVLQSQARNPQPYTLCPTLYTRHPTPDTIHSKP